MPSAKYKMQSILSRGSSFLSSKPSTPKPESSFHTAPTDTALFPQPDPAIDGEACLHDCESCTIKYPRKWSIDESDKLYGHVNGWATQLLVATGKTDWVRDVSDEKGSVMEAVGKSDIKPDNGVCFETNLRDATTYYCLGRNDLRSASEILLLTLNSMPETHAFSLQHSPPLPLPRTP